MADASRRAAAAPSRGGLPNLVFVADGVEQLPQRFDGLADVVTVRFPWGSLLRGSLGFDAVAASSIARLVAPDGCLEIVVSIVERDRSAVGGEGPFGAGDIAAMSRAYADLGLDLMEARRLSAAEIGAMGSSWAKRLRSDAGRPVWQVGFARAIGTVGYPCMEHMQSG